MDAIGPRITTIDTYIWIKPHAHDFGFDCGYWQCKRVCVWVCVIVTIWMDYAGIDHRKTPWHKPEYSIVLWNHNTKVWLTSIHLGRNSWSNPQISVLIPRLVYSTMGECATAMGVTQLPHFMLWSKVVYTCILWNWPTGSLRQAWSLYVGMQMLYSTTQASLKYRYRDYQHQDIIWCW